MEVVNRLEAVGTDVDTIIQTEKKRIQIIVCWKGSDLWRNSEIE